jgi:hypothetical protein
MSMSTVDRLVSSVRDAFSALLDQLASGFGGPQPVKAKDDEPLQPLTPRALVIVYDPVVDSASGVKLSKYMDWNNVDDLVAGYTADIAECSGGLVQYRVVERIDVDEFPLKADGFRYDAASFLAVMNQTAPAHDPDLVDYRRIVTDHHLIERITTGDFDEVWLFGFPYCGFYESRMAGRGAFWCNAPPMEGTKQCPHRFVIMGFSYQRGVGEMLEDLGHRAESVLEKVFEHTRGEANLWKRFSRYDQVAPGQAEVGMLHFAPNSESDYDWGNMRMVLSRCDDWLNFPNFQNVVRPVNCADWGNGDIRLHHKWWFNHIPKVAGGTNGIAHNWWKYFIDPNTV